MSLWLVPTRNGTPGLLNGGCPKVACLFEEARETLGYVVQSENNKMTEIDTLKAKVAELERALENARRS